MFKLIKKWKDFKKNLSQSNRKLFIALDWIETGVVALVLALIVRAYVVQTSLVISGSMIPTIEVSDRILVNKFIYNFREPQRGEIVLFKYPKDESKDFVKRVFGLPNDKLEMKDGVIFVNDVEIAPEGYNINKDDADFGPINIPKESFFMIGDNRPNSADSRFWGFVPRKNIIGQAFFTIWPPQRFGLLR